MNISAIDTLECIADGDTIVPGMSYALPAGVGTTQYYNPSDNSVTPSYTSANPVILYPTCYSSGKGTYIEPDANSYQWYLNSPQSEENRILDSKGATTTRDARFEASTYTVSGKTFPCLKIVDNLASSTNLNDVLIYCTFTYGGLSVTCHGTIAVKETTGDLYNVLINCVNTEGLNDTVIDYDTEYLALTASLQNNGVTVSDATGAVKWLRATAAGNTQVTHTTGVSEISTTGNTKLTDDKLVLYDAAVEGVEEYFAEVVYNGITYRSGIQVADIHDPYYIEIGRNLTSSLVKESQEVVYTPSVINRSTGKAESGWTFTFLATDHNGYSVQQSGVTTFKISGADIKKYGTICVHITATNS
jgi:hypothetical protein